MPRRVVAVPETVASGPIHATAPNRGTLDAALQAFEANTIPLWIVSAIVGGLISLWDVTGWSLWYDEAATFSAIDRSIPDLLRMLGHIDAPLGFYYVLLHLWSLIAGTSELALRLPSVLAAAGAAALTTVIGRRSGSASVGLAAGLLLSMFPMLNSQHAQEARPYTLTVFFACAATLALLVAIEDRRRRWWLVYGVAIGSLGLTHFLTLFLLPAHLGYCWLSAGRGSLWRWLLVTAVSILPAAGVVLVSLTQGAAWRWIKPSTIDTLYQLPVVSVGDTALAWLLFGLALSALVREQGRWRWLLAGWLLIPPLALWTASIVVRPMFVSRYLLIVAPALALLAAMGLYRARLVIPGLLLAAFLAVPAAVEWRDGPSGYEDYRGAATYVTGNMLPGDAIVYDGDGFRLGLAYYFRSLASPGDILIRGSAADYGWLAPPVAWPQAALLAPYDRVWVVHGAEGVPFANSGEVLQGRRPIEERAFKGEVVVTLYERDSS